MKLAYRLDSSPQVTRPIRTDLKPTFDFRLAWPQGTGTAQKFLLNTELLNKLNEDIWPDVPLAVQLPVWKPPKKWAYVLKDPPPRPGSMDNPYKRIVSPEYVSYVEAYNAQLDRLEDVMRARLKITRGFKEADIPHSGCKWYEFRDRRYVEIPIDPVRFTGRMFWIETDLILWDDFVKQIMRKREPIKWIAYHSLYKIIDQ